MRYKKMKSNMDGEGVVIIILVFIMFGLGFLNCFSGISGLDNKTAKQEAEQFAKDVGLNVKGINCANTDSDHDGYVSCTLSIEDKDGNINLQGVECATKVNINSGCRVQKIGNFVRK